MVNAKLEQARVAKEIGANLEARAVLYYDPSKYGETGGADLRVDGLSPEQVLSEVFVTSDTRIVHEPPPAGAERHAEDPAVAALVERAPGHKCARCWRVLPEVSAPKYLCVRCDDAVAAWDEAHGKVDA